MCCDLLIDSGHIPDQTLAHLITDVVNVLGGREENIGPVGVSALRKGKGLVLMPVKIPVCLPAVRGDADGDLCSGDPLRLFGPPSCNAGGGHFLLELGFIVVKMCKYLEA